jgi:hypothetical protein
MGNHSRASNSGALPSNLHPVFAGLLKPLRPAGQSPAIAIGELPCGCQFEGGVVAVQCAFHQRMGESIERERSRHPNWSQD